MTLPPPEERVAKRGSGWKWLLLIGGCGCLLAVGAVVAAVVGFGVFVSEAVRSHPGYELTMERARTSPTLIETIGEPLDVGLAMRSSIRQGDDSGEAEFRFPVSGPGGSGHLESQLIQKDGEWQLTRFLFDPSGTKPSIDLLERDAALDRGEVEER